MDAEEHGYELRKGQVKKKTEGLITAAQNQVLRKSSIKSLIDKQHIPPKFRLCGERVDCKYRFKNSFQSKNVIPTKKIYLFQLKKAITLVFFF